ncbi:MAG: glycosyltransferase family 4 protein [Flavobacteriaceae bacterium]
MQPQRSTRILILCSLDQSLINFRQDMMLTLIANGYTVFAAAPDIEDTTSTELKSIGVIPKEYRLDRNGLNPWKDLNSIIAIRNIIVKNEIDILFPYTIKPVIYGSIAGRLTGISVISLITGLGFTFSKSSRRAHILQKVTELLYKISIAKNKAVIFQNEDDLQLFRQKRILSKKQMAHIVDGSGINLENYRFRQNNNDSQRIVFVLVARLIREKGVELFIEAAKTLKKEFVEAEFHLIGEPDLSVSAVSTEKLERLHNNNIIVYHGFQQNISHFLTSSDVFVLPTYYREGIPRSILEALSIGMPIITTNTPGCKETVTNKENGFLIEPNKLPPLTAAIRYFLENPETIRPMGIESRKLAEERFNVEIINKKILGIINDNI